MRNSRNWIVKNSQVVQWYPCFWLVKFWSHDFRRLGLCRFWTHFAGLRRDWGVSGSLMLEFVTKSEFSGTPGFPETDSAPMKNIWWQAGRCRFGKSIWSASIDCFIDFNDRNFQAGSFFFDGFLHVCNHADRRVQWKLSVRDSVRGNQPGLRPSHADSRESVPAGVLQHESYERLWGEFNDSS